MEFMACLILILKPLTDEKVFYDKFSCGKFYLLVCTRNFANFSYDKCTCRKASMLACQRKTCHRKIVEHTHVHLAK